MRVGATLYKKTGNVLIKRSRDIILQSDNFRRLEMESYKYERCDNVFLCLSELIDHMLRMTTMTRTDVFSYAFRMIKGNKDFLPLKVYRKPLNCLPFDDFELIEGAELGMLMEELRDCAHREAESHSIIDYVKREAAIRRLGEAEIPTGDITLEHGSAEPAKPAKGRESSALKDAFWLLWEEKGNANLPLEASANILTTMATNVGRPRSFDPDTFGRWVPKGHKTKAA